MKSGQVWYQYVRVIYNTNLDLIMLIHIFDNFAVSIFLYNDYFSYLSVEVNKAFIF